MEKTNLRTDLDTFIDELYEFSKSGKKPALASRELRFQLEKQRERIKRYDLEMEEKIDHTKDEIYGGLSRKGTSIRADVVYREGVRRLSIRKDGKQLYRKEEPVIFYATELYREGYSDDLCVCPGCGNSARKSKMREGCPYCGTVFEVEDAWPVFSCWYDVRSIVERGRLIPDLKRNLTILFGISMTVSFVLYLLNFSDMDMPWRILAALFAAAFSSAGIVFVAYMLNSLFLLFQLMKEAGRSLPLLKGIKTGKKLEEKMKEYEPDFSFSYFEGRVLSLLRMIAFSEKRDELSVYEGEEDLSFLDDLIDMQYRGALQLLDFMEKDNVLHVKVRAFMDDLHYNGRIFRKDEDLIVTLEKDVDPTFDPGFSLNKVECRNCGASFDALHRKKCPYCGSEYKLIHDDWMITSIRRR